MVVQELVINPEFEKLIPPLSKEEFEQLEKNILSEGIRDALVAWNRILIDGHNRFKIAEKHGLEYDTIEKHFASEDEAKVWMIDNQKGRRNLTDGWKFELEIKKKEFLTKKGKERRELNLKQNNTDVSIIDTSDTKKTQQIIADNLGWSAGKVAQAEVVWKKAPKETIEQIKTGDITINQAYNEIKKEEKKAERIGVINNQLQKIESGELPELIGLYDVISVDPPWAYEEKGGFSSNQHDPISNRGGVEYPTMNISEIKNIQLPLMDDAVVFLWATQSFLRDAFDILESWGLKYKATIVWDKELMGMGRTIRLQCEFCLIGFKGNPYFNGVSERDIIRAKRREHSRKPDEFFELVERVTLGRRLEYFSREQRDGWQVYGNETNKF